MFPATFLQCALYSLSFLLLSLGDRPLKYLVCRAFHNAPDPSLQGHWGSLCASINCIYGEALQRASLKRVTGAWASAIINLVRSRPQPPLCSVNGALIAGTTSWVGWRGGVCLCDGCWGLKRGQAVSSIIHLFQSSSETNEPWLIT